MKETGIIMSGEHPKLILDGSKTQTRRVIVHQAVPNSDIVSFKEFLYVPESKRKSEMDVPEGYYALLNCNANQDRNIIYFRCPYGQAGDRLWVRETFSKIQLREGGEEIVYKANSPDLKYKWKPSIHMFRKDSRITLEITEVRVERVQEISNDDAKAEGCPCSTILPDGRRLGSTHRYFFKELWDSLNAKRGYGWDVNPWCWAISFRRFNG